MIQKTQFKKTWWQSKVKYKIKNKKKIKFILAKDDLPKLIQGTNNDWLIYKINNRIK